MSFRCAVICTKTGNRSEPRIDPVVCFFPNTRKLTINNRNDPAYITIDGSHPKTSLVKIDTPLTPPKTMLLGSRNRLKAIEINMSPRSKLI